jgi:hypothetical protein
MKEKVIEELSAYQDISKGDGKRLAMAKEDIKIILGRSPDHSDTWIMRMYFEIRDKMSPYQSEEKAMLSDKLQQQFTRRKNQFKNNSTK